MLSPLICDDLDSNKHCIITQIQHNNIRGQNIFFCSNDQSNVLTMYLNIYLKHITEHLVAFYAVNANVFPHRLVH
jgi:hypothetical protein